MYNKETICTCVLEIFHLKRPELFPCDGHNQSVSLQVVSFSVVASCTAALLGGVPSSFTQRWTSSLICWKDLVVPSPALDILSQLWVIQVFQELIAKESVFLSYCIRIEAFHPAFHLRQEHHQ